MNKIYSKLLLILSVVILVIILLLPSCLKKDDYDFDKIILPDWEPNLSLPLIHSKLDLSKILSNDDLQDFLIEDANKFLTLVYRGKLLSQSAQDVFQIDNQFLNSNFSFSLPGGFSVGDSVTTTHSEDLIFSTSNNEILDTVYLKSGLLNYQLNTNLNHNARIRIILPTVRKNGIPFTTTIDYVYNGGSSNINLNFDLSDYKLVYHHTGGIFNQLNINFEITAYNTLGAPNNSPYNFSSDISFQDLEYKLFFGYLNTINFLFPNDSLGIDIFKNSWFGNFFLEDPRLILTISNSYGFPLDIFFDHITATNPITSTSTNITGIPGTLPITPPAFLGVVGKTVLILDKNNSNFKNVLSDLPHYLTYLLEGRANPTGVYTPNFALDTSVFEIDVEVELPLYGRAWDFVIEDTMDFQLDNVEEIVNINFKINITNGFPIDTGIQLFFADSAYNVLDSLFTYTQEIVLAASGGAPPDYRVTTPRHKYTEANLTTARLKNINNARNLIIRATLATTNNGNDIMKIYSDYTIEVRLAVQAQLKVNLNNQ